MSKLDLTPDQKILRQCVRERGGCFLETGKGETVRIIGDRDYGYLNETVNRLGGVMGYRSPERDRCENGCFRNGCLPKDVGSAQRLFEQRYGVSRGATTWDLDENGGKCYLIIKDLDLAKKACNCFCF